MDNFCTNCGAKIEKDYKFCINCGTKIDKSDITDNTHTFKSMPDNYEKEKAKTELKRIVGGKIFFNESFNDELRKNGLSFYAGAIIKEKLEKEIDAGQLKSGDVKSRMNQLIQEYKDIEQKEENARIAKQNEMMQKKNQSNEMKSGGYCGFNCIHYCEEFLDDHGGIVGDFDSAGYVEYYCNLGHPISNGSFCKDYE